MKKINLKAELIGLNKKPIKTSADKDAKNTTLGEALSFAFEQSQREQDFDKFKIENKLYRKINSENREQELDENEIKILDKKVHGAFGHLIYNAVLDLIEG